MRTILILFLLLALVPPIHAQSDEPQRIEIAASDGLTLVGDFYPSDQTSAPAVLLLHMMGSSRTVWQRTGLIDELVAAGYAVLAVDLRGYGQTGGAHDWILAEQDIQIWIDWLRDQPNVDPDRIDLVGGSIGAMLALRAMMNDGDVVTAITLSPNLTFIGVDAETAMIAIRDRPIYMIGSHGDRPAADCLRRMADLAEGDALIQFYAGSIHGTDLFFTHPDLAPALVRWLDTYNKDDE